MRQHLDDLAIYLDHYKDQLVAGYTKITPGFGFRSYFRDYNKLRTTQNNKSHRGA